MSVLAARRRERFNSMKASWIVGVALFSFASLGVGCGASTPAATPEGHHAASPAGVVKAPGEAAIGDVSTCPVSKETFTITAASPKATYGGKTYYFCCAGCEQKFQSDPKKYSGGGT